MLKLLKIILGNIKKDLLHDIIMIVFVGLSIFLMNISLSRFMHQEYLNNIVREYGLYDNYMYAAPPDKSVYYNSQNEKKDQGFSALKYVRTRLEELKSDGIIENYFNAEHFTHGIDNIEYMLYPRELVLDMNFPLSKGKWFSPDDIGRDYTPVIVGSGHAGNYKVGETVELLGIDGKCNVIGILERNAMVLTVGAGGNGMDINNTFVSGNNMVIACVPKIDEFNGSGGTIIKTSPQNQKQVFNEIGDIVYTFTFKELAESAYESNRLITEMQTTVFILMMVVCIAGVSSGNLLAAISCQKKYATYFLCGMDWKTGVLATLAEGLIKLVIPAAAGYAMFYKWCVDQNFWALRVTDVNLILTIVFLTVIFILTSLKPLLDIKHTSPVKIIVET